MARAQRGPPRLDPNTTARLILRAAAGHVGEHARAARWRGRRVVAHR
jgi:hypothetical protein